METWILFDPASAEKEDKSVSRYSDWRERATRKDAQSESRIKGVYKNGWLASNQSVISQLLIWTSATRV